MAVLVMLPLAGTVLMGVLAARALLRRAASSRSILAQVRTTGLRTVVAGHPVLLVPDRAPLAFALPRRHGGIVLSRGLMDSLTPQQLSAVLAHEQAHLSQHHHAMLAVLGAMPGPLRMIPLFDAVATTVPHLLEIAADDASRHRRPWPARCCDSPRPVPHHRRPSRRRRARCCTRPDRPAAARTGSGTWSPPPPRARRWCRRPPSPACSPCWPAPRSSSSRRTRCCC